jgi:hypothetical protein
MIGRRVVEVSTRSWDFDVEPAELAIVIWRDFSEQPPIVLDANGLPEGWDNLLVNNTYGEFVLLLHPKSVDHVDVLRPFNPNFYGEHSLVLHKHEPDKQSGFNDVGRIWFNSGGLFAFGRHACKCQELMSSGDWYGGTGMSCVC